MKSSKFDIEYNEWLHQVDVGEEDSVWEGVQNELDFMETWDNISTQLDVVMPQQSSGFAMKYLKPFIAAAALILLMLLLVKDVTDRAMQPEIVSEQPGEVSKKEILPPDETMPVKAEKEEITIPRAIALDRSREESLDKNTTSVASEHSPIAVVENKNAEDIQRKKTNEFKNIEQVFIESKATGNSAVNKKEILINRIQPLSLNYNDLLPAYNVASSELLKNRAPDHAEPDISSGFTLRVLQKHLVA